MLRDIANKYNFCANICWRKSTEKGIFDGVSYAIIILPKIDRSLIIKKRKEKRTQTK